MAEREQPSTHERLVALETRIAYQDYQVAQLDEVVVEFSRRVQQLEETVRALRAALGSAPDVGPDEKPPHY